MCDEYHLLSVLREFVAYYNQGPTASNARTQHARAEARSDNRSDPVTAGIFERAAITYTNAPPASGSVTARPDADTGSVTRFEGFLSVFAESHDTDRELCLGSRGFR